MLATRATHATATPSANIRKAEALQRRLKSNTHLAIHGQGDSTEGILSAALSRDGNQSDTRHGNAERQHP